MAGKHTSDGITIKKLEERVKAQEQEILDIKRECAEQFKKIYEMSTSNTLGNEHVKIKRMAEISKDNFNILLDDLMDYTTDEKGKIIELPNTDQSTK